MFLAAVLLIKQPRNYGNIKIYDLNDLYGNSLSLQLQTYRQQ